MVVREQRVYGDSQASMHSQLAMDMDGGEGEEEDSNDSSDYALESNQRKRKVDETDEEKRRRNREAAKRCRDKKQKQTEDLKDKNTDLEKENCQLAKQRDDLVRKCKEYQREIEQHKQKGCVVLHFNPPYNLDHLVHPSSPPSPAYSESAPSTSSCPSPAPSGSPGPARCLAPPGPADLPHNMLFQEAIPSSAGVYSHPLDMATACTTLGDVTSVPTSACPATTQDTPDSNQPYYIRIRSKDGSRKILAMDRENYLKVMQRVRAHRTAAAQPMPSESVQPSSSASAVTDSTSPFQQMAFQQEQARPQTTVNPGMMQSSFLNSEEEQEASPKSGQKLDTCEDLISILKTHVKNTGNGFELTPVSESEIGLPIKQEPLDADYEQSHFLNADGQVELTGVKQEDMAMSEFVTWSSMGQQIRTSLDTLTNPDDMSSRAEINNILQYLKTDEQMVPATIRGASPLQQPTARRIPLTQTTSAARTQMVTYVTSSAPVGALNKRGTVNNQAPALSMQGARQQAPDHISAQRLQAIGDASGGQGVMSPAMQTIKLRTIATSLVSSPSPAPGRQFQTAVASSAVVAHTNGQGALGMNTSMPGRINVTPSSSMPQSVTTTGVGAGSLQATRNPSLMPGQGLSPSPVLQQQQQPPSSAMSFHPIPSTTIDTSSIGPLHMHDAPLADNLMSESTSQIVEYLKASSIETMYL
ncbi:hypothetical protein ACOMHN_065753 [Nucella lapillus]